jgi:peroxiredoxin Q/BCP
MYGKEYDGVLRSTVLIDERGTVVKTYPKVSPDEHADDIVADLRALSV